MKVSKFTPAAPVTFGSLRDEFDRIVDRFMYPATLTSRIPEEMWSPRLDFSENEKAFVVRLEAPGVEKSDIDVKFEGDVLTLRGTRSIATEGTEEEYVWRERESGTFVRAVRMPSHVDGAKVEAKMDRGILTVTLPKTEPGISTRIPVT